MPTLQNCARARYHSLAPVLSLDNQTRFIYHSTMDEKILNILIDIKADIGGLKKGQAELKADVADIKVDVAILKSDVAELKGRVGRLERDMTEVKSEVKAISHALLDTSREVARMRGSG